MEIESIYDKINCPKCNEEFSPEWELNPDPDTLYYSAECDFCGVFLLLYPEKYRLEIDE